MTTQRILLAENDRDAVSTLCQLLQHEGHTVHTALSSAIAREQQGRRSIDLLITDVRLSDDRDWNDQSGLDLAYDRLFFDTPKLIWTAFSSEALQKRVGDIPGVIAIVAKQEGPLKVLQCVASFASDRRLELRQLADRRLAELGLSDAHRVIAAITRERVLIERRYSVVFGALLAAGSAPLVLAHGFSAVPRDSNLAMVAQTIVVVLLSLFGLTSALRERQRNAFRESIVTQMQQLHTTDGSSDGRVEH
jgi:CheY-like chemotaxis protein